MLKLGIMTYSDPFEDQLTYVVGIGASAGGLEALKNLLTHLADDTQMAFLILQHFPAGQPSMMDEILHQYTKMPIQQVQNTAQIKPNQIYLLPSHCQIRFNQGKIQIDSKPQARSPYSISSFFKSLGQSYRERAIGVILSGTGSDGSEGFKVLKEHEGLTMIQSPAEARFASMPNAALTQNLADFELSTEPLAQELARLASQAPWHKKDRSERPEIELKQQDQQQLKQILLELRKTTQIDFQPYRRQTIIRRLLKRMRILNITELSIYYQYLTSHPEEPQALTRDFLINVTRFFRDREVWEHLRENVIPELCAGRSKEQPLRIWSAGCASGEEAYSLAMLIQDHIESHDLELSFKIFATDLDEEVVQFASKGRYSEAQLESISPDFRSRFFNQEGPEYLICKELREHLVFARHNLLSDPPFLKQDLICCRNMLLYIQPEFQRKILNTLHFALNLGGYLLLGNSETLGPQARWFEPPIKHLNLFKNKEMASSQLLNLDNSFSTYKTSSHAYAQNIDHAPTPRLPQGPSFYEQSLLNDFVPPTLFVNTEGEVLFTHGNLHPFIIFPRGHIQFHLSALLEVEEYQLIKNGLLRVSQTKQPIEYQSVLLERDRKTYKANIQIKVIWHPEMEQEVFLLSFVTAQHQPEPFNQINSSQFLKEQFEAVKADLHYKTLQISQMREKLEASNEELQASNEELLASNEELQSTNEELQSVNEELYTVNSELENKIRSLAELNADLDNFLSSTKIGFIFLDHNLMLRKFTPSIHTALHLIESDVGRSISHFSVHFDQGINLVKIAQQVLSQQESYQQEVSIEEQEYLLRALPYLTQSGEVAGVVLTLVDLSELNQVRRLAQLMDARYQTIVDHIPNYVTICDQSGLIEYGNERSREQFGKLTMRPSLAELFGAEKVLYSQALSSAANEERTVSLSTQQQIAGQAAYFEHSICALPDNKEQQDKRFIVMTRDITEIHQYQQEIQDQAVKLQSVIDTSNDVITAVDSNEHLVISNQAYYQLSEQLCLPDEKEGNLTLYHILLPFWRQALQGEDSETQVKLQTTTGSRSYNLLCTPLQENNLHLGTVRLRDMTSTHKAQAELQSTLAELRRSNTYLDNFVYTAAHDLRAPIANLMSLVSRMQRQAEIREHPLFSYLDRSILSLEKILSGLIQVIDSQKESADMAIELSLETILSEVIEGFPELAEGSEHRIICDLDAKNISYIEPYMRSILQNLIDNAIKYRHKNQPLVIEIQTKPTPDGISLTIQDNGQGLPDKAKTKHLFQAFKRYHTAQLGSGIGLYLIKTLIEKNGGQVQAAALQKQGLKFMLEFRAY